MEENIVHAGGVSFDLSMLVHWSWKPETQFLVIRLVDKTLCLNGEQAYGVWTILNTLAEANGLPRPEDRLSN